MKQVASEPDPSRKAFPRAVLNTLGRLPLAHCHLYISDRSNGTGFPPPTRKVSHLKGSGEISDTCHVSGALRFLKERNFFKAKLDSNSSTDFHSMYSICYIYLRNFITKIWFMHHLKHLCSLQLLLDLNPSIGGPYYLIIHNLSIPI
jgi:hypothetical protein